MANTIEYIYRLSDQYSKKLKTMSVVQKKFARDVSGVKEKMKGFETGLKTFAKVGIGAAIVGIGVAVTKGVSLASDLVEAQNVVSTTFKESTPVMDAWAKTALESFGLSELQAKKMTGTMGALLKSSGITGDQLVGMSQNLTGLAGDFASFYNLPHEMAFDKLRAGISGETEPLKALGINMSVANMETFALTQGITKQWKAMSQAEQALLRYKFIMNASKDAQGDFNKTLGTSLANQARVLQTRFGAKLAQAMLPILPKLTGIFKTLNEYIANINAEEIGKKVAKAFTAVVAVIKKAIAIFSVLYKILKAISPVILGLVFAWKAYKLMLMSALVIAPLLKFIRITLMMAKAQKSLNVVQAAFNLLMKLNPIGMIITAIGVAIGLTYLLWKNWDKIRKLFVVVTDSMAGLFGMDADKLRESLLRIVDYFIPIVSIIREVKLRWEYVKLAFTTGGIGKGLIAIGKTIVSMLLKPLETILMVASKIPGIGKWAKSSLEGIANFKRKMFGDEEKMRKKQIEMEKQRAKLEKNINKEKNENILANIKKVKGEVDKLSGDAEKITVKRVGDIATMLSRSQYAQKYVSAPQQQTISPVQVGGAQMDATMNLNVYKERGVDVQPYQKSGNLGVNMNYME